MKKQILAVVAAVATLTASPAFALTVIQTHDITTAETTFSFDQFDSSLGTLDSVTLSFSAIVNTLGSITNKSNADKVFTLSKSAIASLTGAGFNLDATLLSGTTDYAVAKKSNPVHSAAVSLNGTGSDADTLTSGLATFIGAGDLDFIFGRSTQFSINPASGDLVLASNMSGSATLTYNYTAPIVKLPENPGDGLPGPSDVPPVPEPATWMMMILGFAGIAAALRRGRHGQGHAAALAA